MTTLLTTFIKPQHKNLPPPPLFALRNLWTAPKGLIPNNNQCATNELPWLLHTFDFVKFVQSPFLHLRDQTSIIESFFWFGLDFLLSINVNGCFSACTPTPQSCKNWYISFTIRKQLNKLIILKPFKSCKMAFSSRPSIGCPSENDLHVEYRDWYFDWKMMDSW